MSLTLGSKGQSLPQEVHSRERKWREQTCEQINALQFDKMSELGGGEI